MTTTTNAATPGIDEQFRKFQHVQVGKQNLNPSTPEAHKMYTLWKKKFTIYTDVLEADDTEKLNILINRLDFNNYEYINNLPIFDEAIAKLD